MGRARRPAPVLGPDPGYRAEALDDTARQTLVAAAVLGRRVDGRLLAAMVEPAGEAVVAALDLPLDSVVGHVLHLHRRVSPWCPHWTRPGGTVVTLIG